MDGVVTMSWGELTARAIKPELRGHMMGMQVAIAGAISLLTGALLAWLLATPALTDHYRFGFVFILTAVLVLASIIFIRIVKDPNPTPAPEKYDFRKYYARILPFIKTNKALRHVLIARMPGYIGFTVLSFMVVFGANTLDLSGTQISLLVYSKIVGALIGGFVLAETSRRLGNKAVILLCNVGVIITLLMATALIYIPALGYIWLISLCIFAALWQNNWLGYMNYIIDISPTDDRPAFQVIGSVIGIPFSFAGFALGAVIDYWGFLVAFIICGISAVMALVTSLRLLSRKRITQGDGSLGL
jgi:Na+/melibiose symporter-like transporter